MKSRGLVDVYKRQNEKEPQRGTPTGNDRGLVAVPHQITNEKENPVAQTEGTFGDTNPRTDHNNLRCGDRPVGCRKLVGSTRFGRIAAVFLVTHALHVSPVRTDEYTLEAYRLMRPSQVCSCTILGACACVANLPVSYTHLRAHETS